MFLQRLWSAEFWFNIPSVLLNSKAFRVAVEAVQLPPSKRFKLITLSINQDMSNFCNTCLMPKIALNSKEYKFYTFTPCCLPRILRENFHSLCYPYSCYCLIIATELTFDPDHCNCFAITITGLNCIGQKHGRIKIFVVKTMRATSANHTFLCFDSIT